MDEWMEMIKSLPNEKASGPTKISNEMLKKADEAIHKNLLFLTNLCLITGNIPSEWRIVLLYPIPKMMEWKYTLINTRLIILLETIRKVITKIVTKKLSNIITQHNILKGENHAVLSNSLTEVPLRIINTCMEDAKRSNKELQLTFQDLSKAYNRVDFDMLRLVMSRIKIPCILQDFIVNLFSNSYNKVIHPNGISDEFTSLIGIDQGGDTFSITLDNIL